MSEEYFTLRPNGRQIMASRQAFVKQRPWYQLGCTLLLVPFLMGPARTAFTPPYRLETVLPFVLMVGALVWMYHAVGRRWARAVPHLTEGTLLEARVERRENGTVLYARFTIEDREGKMQELHGEYPYQGNATPMPGQKVGVAYMNAGRYELL